MSTTLTIQDMENGNELTLPEGSMAYDKDLNLTTSYRIMPITINEKTHLIGTVAEWMPTFYKKFNSLKDVDVLDPVAMATGAYEQGLLDDWIIDRSSVGGGVFTVVQLRLPTYSYSTTDKPIR